MADPMDVRLERQLGGAEERAIEARPVGSEIARRRAARDLWVSRSHVAAAGALALALAALTFAGGLALGKRWAAPAPTPPPSLTAEVPRDELLQLLARIDGNAAGPSAAITFPDTLRGQPSAGGGGGDGPPPHQTVVAGGPQAVVGDALGGGGFTVVVATTPDEAAARAQQAALLEAGVSALVAAELVEGAPRYRVVVGRHADRERAVAAARLLAGAGDVVVEPLLPDLAEPPVEPAPAPAPVEAPPAEPAPSAEQ